MIGFRLLSAFRLPHDELTQNGGVGGWRLLSPTFLPLSSPQKPMGMIYHLLPRILLHLPHLCPPIILRTMAYFPHYPDYQIHYFPLALVEFKSILPFLFGISLFP